jgi:hypothetical protein
LIDYNKNRDVFNLWQKGRYRLGGARANFRFYRDNRGIRSTCQSQHIEREQMSKSGTISLLIIILTVLFGLLALPILASELKAPLSSSKYITSFESSARVSSQLTFTPVTTLYLPIILNPLNELKIVSLIYKAQDEYVEIKNNGPGAESMDGWQIVSVKGSQIYTFPNGITFSVGQTVRIHSGPAAFNSPPNDLLWTTSRIWRNKGDIAALLDNEGALRYTYCFLDGCQ